VHFTYQAVAENDGLSQGDLVKRTPEVEAILREVHPHYSKPDYKYFLVLTQTCDLVRRGGGSCESPYITICAVRPLSLALERELARFQYDALEKRLGFCEETRKAKLRQFIERLFNNNEDRYFFLARDPEVELDEDYCAFLKLSISLKSSLHYGTLMNARLLRLNDSFQHKLGFLVGLSYSRVGTTDWAPTLMSGTEFESLAAKRLEQEVTKVIWLEKKHHRRVLEKLKTLPLERQELGVVEEVAQEIKREKEETREMVLQAIADNLAGLLPAESIEKFKKRLRNNPVFTGNLK
jgi:hypothetical protein